MLNDQSGLVLGDSTVFSWAGCHICHQSSYMHRRLINNLNHWFFNKIGKIIWICKIRWSVKDKLDRVALEEILGSLGGLLTYGLFC
jgi:hypothetical protein